MKNKLLLIAMGFVLTTQMIMAQVPSYVPTNGLVGYWPFNGNANDESGNGNNGVVNGATLTTNRFGNTNSSYTFNGNSEINIPSINQNSDWSISFWFSSLNLANFGLQYPLGIGCTSLSAYGAPGFGINGGTQQNPCNSLQLNKMFLTDGATQCTSNLWASQNYLQQVWYHVVINNLNSQYSIFVNGQQQITGNLADVNIDNLILGRRCNFNLLKFIGKIDDLSIWNRVLTQDEITSLYYAENSCQSLVINTGVLGFNPVTYNNTVTIYPNPANEQITIDCGNLANVSGWTIKIVNTLGQEVFSGAMNTQQYVVPLNSWSGQGVYFVKIYDASNNLLNTKKIILQ